MKVSQFTKEFIRRNDISFVGMRNVDEMDSNCISCDWRFLRNTLRNRGKRPVWRLDMLVKESY